MNINPNPPAESPSNASPGKNPCFGTDSTVAMLDVFVCENHDYMLSYAQLLYAERVANPALEKDPEAPPEKLKLCFAVAEVIVLGSGLKIIEREAQTHDLKFVKAVDRRYASAFNTHIAAITITFSKEDV